MNDPAPRLPPRPFILPPAPPVVLKPIPAWEWFAAVFAVVASVIGVVVFARWTRARSYRATAAVVALHRKMMRADDVGIFADADTSYREMVTAPISDSMFDNIRERLGAPHGSTLIRSDVATYDTRGNFMTLHYFTAFDKGSGSETICLHDVNGVWKLAAYNVESPLLHQNKPAPLLPTKMVPR